MNAIPIIVSALIVPIHLDGFLGKKTVTRKNRFSPSASFDIMQNVVPTGGAPGENAEPYLAAPNW